MKLNELTGLKNKDSFNDSHDLKNDIKNALLKNGFKYLKSGIYGMTFMGKSSVLKVFFNDPAYEYYIKTLKDTPNKYKQFIPKVTNIRKYPPNPTIKFVVLEKLVNSHIYSSVNFKYIFKEYNNILNKEFNNHDELLSLFSDVRMSNVDKNILNGFFNIFSIDFIKFVVYLYNNKDQYNFDLHNDNIMSKGNTYVIIDPYSK